MLDVAGSDDKLGIAEDTLLNKTAKSLNLDLRHFQEMKSIAIANISEIEHSEKMDETVFNLTADMSKSEKCKDSEKNIVNGIGRLIIQINY